MATCAAGVCGTRCLAGHADCDGNPSNGCEVDLATDASHCGSCPNACPARPHATPACTAGACDILCTGSYRDCDGTAANAKAIESAARTVPLSKASWEYAQKAGAV
jgi:hypothetical protein